MTRTTLQKELSRVQSDLEVERTVRKKLDEELEKFKKKWEKGDKDREAAVRDFGEISEQYNELINEFNALKDRHRQDDTHSTNLETELE